MKPVRKIVAEQDLVTITAVPITAKKLLPFTLRWMELQISIWTLDSRCRLLLARAPRTPHAVRDEPDVKGEQLEARSQRASHTHEHHRQCSDRRDAVHQGAQWGRQESSPALDCVPRPYTGALSTQLKPPLYAPLNLKSDRGIGILQPHLSPTWSTSVQQRRYIAPQCKSSRGDC